MDSKFKQRLSIIYKLLRRSPLFECFLIIIITVLFPVIVLTISMINYGLICIEVLPCVSDRNIDKSCPFGDGILYLTYEVLTIFVLCVIGVIVYIFIYEHRIHLSKGYPIYTSPLVLAISYAIYCACIFGIVNYNIGETPIEGNPPVLLLCIPIFLLPLLIFGLYNLIFNCYQTYRSINKNLSDFDIIDRSKRP